MKKILKIFIVVIIAAMLGCSANKSHQNDSTTSQTSIKGYTKQVTNADLYKFLEANQKNPSLNAVKMKVADVENILRGFPSNGDVYITITDTKADGRSITVVGSTEEKFTRICAPRCCPPPYPCQPDFINNIQFVDRFVFNEHIGEQKIKKRL